MSPLLEEWTLDASQIWRRPGRTLGAGVLTHGTQVNATNTGLTSSVGALTTGTAGTVSTAGSSVVGKAFTGTLNLTGAGSLVENCLFTLQGMNTMGIQVNAPGCTIRNCWIINASGRSFYIGVLNNSSNTTIERCEISGGENAVTTIGQDFILQNNYLHDASQADNPDAHVDLVEVYGGSGTIRRNRLYQGPLMVDAPINIAPYDATSNVEYVVIDSNFVDGGQAHFIVDNQRTGSGYTRNVEITNNVLGGHTGPTFGRYKALQNNDGRPIVATKAGQAANPEAIFWANNFWGECSGLTPDRTGEVAAAA